MKKQNSLYRMTTSEMQIMTYLWNSKEPAIASQIVSDLIPTQNCTWKPRSVFTILKSLSEKDLIHDVGYVRTGKTYSRKFAPKVSRAEYHAGHERTAGPGAAGIFGVLSGEGRLSVTGKSNSQVSAVCSAGTFLYR